MKERIEALEKELAEIKASLREQEKGGSFRTPKEYYFFVAAGFKVTSNYDAECIGDDVNYKNNNYFHSEEEAEHEAKYRKFEAQVARRFRELNGGIYKFKTGRPNYTISFDGHDVGISSYRDTQLFRRDWQTDNEEIAEQIKSEFDFKAYFLGEL